MADGGWRMAPSWATTLSDARKRHQCQPIAESPEQPHPRAARSKFTVRGVRASTSERLAISRRMVFATLVAGLLAAEAAHATESDIISIRPAQVLDVRSGKLRRDVIVQIQGERVLCVDSCSWDRTGWCERNRSPRAHPATRPDRRAAAWRVAADSTASPSPRLPPPPSAARTRFEPLRQIAPMRESFPRGAPEPRSARSRNAPVGGALSQADRRRSWECRLRVG